jgi:hypothetical protein
MEKKLEAWEMTTKDEMNCRLAEQQEKHYNEIKELKNRIAELEAENKTFINIMDSQSKAIDIFNNIIRSYVERDEMKSTQKRNV